MSIADDHEADVYSCLCGAQDTCRQMLAQNARLSARVKVLEEALEQIEVEASQAGHGALGGYLASIAHDALSTRAGEGGA